MAAKPGFGALGIFKFHDRALLDGFFSDTEEPCGNLGNHMLFIGKELGRISPFTGTGETIEPFGSPCPSDNNR